MTLFIFLDIDKSKVVKSMLVFISATVAQSVEQLIRNQQVTGSNPVSSSRERP